MARNFIKIRCDSHWRNYARLFRLPLYFGLTSLARRKNPPSRPNSALAPRCRIEENRALEQVRPHQLVAVANCLTAALTVWCRPCNIHNASPKRISLGVPEGRMDGDR